MPRWTITHYAPDRTLKGTYEPLSPGGWLQPWEWTMLPNGDCVRASLGSHHPSMSPPVSPRDLVILALETTPGETPVPVFSGTVTSVRPARYASKDLVQLVGLRDNLKRVLMDHRALTGDSAAVIAGLSDLLPASVLYDAARIGTTGTIVGTPAQPFFMPTSSLADALDALAASEPGMSWGVDASGTLFYGIASGGHTVDYATSVFRWETITADDLVTKATVLIAGNVSPPGATVALSLGENGLGYPYLPVPVTASAEDASHALYQAESVDLPPPGLEPIVLESLVTLNAFMSGPFTSPANATDGNENTNASNTSAGQANLDYDIPAASAAGVIGVDLVYSLATGNKALLTFRRRHSTGETNTGSTVLATLNLEPATYGRIRLVVPYTAQTFTEPPISGVLIRVDATPATAAGVLLVHEVRAILPSTLAMQEVAKSRLNPPAQEPAGVTVREYLAPAIALNVTGTPGGDVIGSISQLTYRYSSQGLVTSISLGLPPGENVARLIRIAARDLDASDRNRMRAYSDRR